MNNLKTARLFFNECDGGKGWEACKAYCHANASFETEDETLAAIVTLDTLLRLDDRCFDNVR